jgi:hypothetical protein
VQQPKAVAGSLAILGQPAMQVLHGVLAKFQIVVGNVRVPVDREHRFRLIVNTQSSRS